MRRRQIYQMQRAALEAASSSPPPVVQLAPAIIDPHACTKCGRIVGRGRVMHEKHCKA